MDQHVWQTSRYPYELLRHVIPHASERKWRLLLCAALRAVWDELPEKLHRVAVEIAENLADGNASASRLDAARANIQLARAEAQRRHDRDAANWAEYVQTALSPHIFGERFRLPPIDQGTQYELFVTDQGMVRRDPRMCRLIRDLFGDPFQRVELPPHVLHARTSNVREIAAEIYAERTFELLPIMADALEDAGCEEESIIAHCRAPHEHFRGCWVVDLLLAKT